MNLVEALKSEPERNCPFKTLKDSLTEPEKEALQFALRNTAKSIREIHDILTSNGYSIGRETLTNHRKGLCPICASA